MSISKRRTKAQRLASQRATNAGGRIRDCVSVTFIRILGIHPPRRGEQSRFFVTKEAEQIAENKETLENLTTNEAKDEPKFGTIRLRNQRLRRSQARLQQP
jgi:hypothetical protein